MVQTLGTKGGTAVDGVGGGVTGSHVWKPAARLDDRSLTPRITAIRIPTASMAAPTGLALNRLTPKESACLLILRSGPNPGLQMQ